MSRTNGQAGRPRMPVKDRMRLGREPILFCCATNLCASDLSRVDLAAARAGKTRSAWFRDVVLAELAKFVNKPVDDGLAMK